MRLLDRYLLRELLIPLGFCLGGFLVFWIAFDVFSRIDDFHEWQFTLLDVGEYYWLKLPELLNTALPVALLLAMLYALTAHSRHNELIAIRAAGLSLWRICLPYFAIGAALSLVLLAINERLLVDAPQRLERMTERRRRPDNIGQDLWRARVSFRNPSAQRYWNLGAFHLETGELQQPRVSMALPEGSYRQITADTVQWTNSYWRLTNGIERLFRDAEDPFPAQKSKTIFSAEEMGGVPSELAQWTGTPVMESNVVVALTNVSHREVATGKSWEFGTLGLTNGWLETLRFRAPLGDGARRLIIAESGHWTNGQWRFFNAREFLYRSATDADALDVFYPDLDLPEFDETPRLIQSEIRVSDLLTRTKAMRQPDLPVRDVWDYLRLHPSLPRRDRALLETQLHARIAAPWTCLVVSVIAIPFGAPAGRRNIFYGVAGSLGLGFLYFVVQRLGFALGQSDLVPGWLGAWLPNVSFGLVGIWLTARVR
ncbi:MAG TPA: LptF/LptG family permease [Verrucomicrobiota bacterium]|nr:LptF/LptG family permease [Verrucomicrobiota bacterium]